MTEPVKAAMQCFTPTAAGVKKEVTHRTRFPLITSAALVTCVWVEQRVSPCRLRSAHHHGDVHTNLAVWTWPIINSHMSEPPHCSSLGTTETWLNIAIVCIVTGIYAHSSGEGRAPSYPILVSAHSRILAPSCVSSLRALLVFPFDLEAILALGFPAANLNLVT